MTPHPFQICDSAYGTKGNLVPTSAANSNSPWMASGPPGKTRMPGFAGSLHFPQIKPSKASLSSICDMQFEIKRSVVPPSAANSACRRTRRSGDDMHSGFYIRAAALACSPCHIPRSRKRERVAEGRVRDVETMVLS